MDTMIEWDETGTPAWKFRRPSILAKHDINTFARRTEMNSSGMTEEEASAINHYKNTKVPVNPYGILKPSRLLAKSNINTDPGKIHCKDKDLERIFEDDW